MSKQRLERKTGDYCGFLEENLHGYLTTSWMQFWMAMDRRWSSPSRITVASQQYFMYHAAKPQHTLSEPSSKAPLGATRNSAHLVQQPLCGRQCRWHVFTGPVNRGSEAQSLRRLISTFGSCASGLLNMCASKSTSKSTAPSLRLSFPFNIFCKPSPALFWGAFFNIFHQWGTGHLMPQGMGMQESACNPIPPPLE